jgi:general secretion pathway protein M
MKLLPDNEHSKLLPVGLLVIVVILVYFIGFHWFIVRHVDYTGELSSMNDQYQRFQATAAKRELLVARLRDLQGSTQEDEFFLDGQNASLAAAQLTNLLKEFLAARVSVPEHCMLVSNQTVRNREEQRFEKVAVNMRLRCHMSEFVKVLHSMETSVPMLFVEDINVFKLASRQSSRNRGNQRQVADNLSLDIRFNLVGYLRASNGPGGAPAQPAAGVIAPAGANTP